MKKYLKFLGFAFGTLSISIGSMFSNVQIVKANAAADLTVNNETYTKLTSSDTVTEGTYIFAYSNGTSTFYLGNFSSSYFTSQSSSSNALILDVKKADESGKFTISYMSGSDEKYFSYSGSSNNISTSSTATTNNQRWTFSYDSGWLVTNAAVTGRVLKYNASSPRFCCYSSGQQKLTLFKKDSNTTPDAAFTNQETMAKLNVSYYTTSSFNEGNATESMNFENVKDRGASGNAGIGFTYNSDNVTFVTTNAYGNSSYIQCYQDCDLTITCSLGIQSIEFTSSANAGSNYSLSKMKFNGVVVGTSGNTATWQPASATTSATFHMDSQVRLTNVSVSFTGNIETVSYHVSKDGSGKDLIGLTFGGCIDASLKKSLDEMGVTEYGVAYKIGNAAEYSYKPLSGAFVASIKDTEAINETITEAITNKHSYQFCYTLSHIPASDWSTVVTATGYAKKGSSYYLMSSKAYSVKTIAAAYLKDHANDEGVIAANGILNMLKDYTYAA